MQLQINFKEGVYSSNKEDIKKVFSILGYKYQNSQKKREDLLICIWKRNNETIKGIFHGSGKQCEFIIDCKDNEEKVFKAIATKYNCIITEPNKQDNNSLLIKAKELVDTWWTNIKQEKDEPNFFFLKRQEKEKQSYNDWMFWQVKALQDDYVAY